VTSLTPYIIEKILNQPWQLLLIELILVGIFWLLFWDWLEGRLAKRSTEKRGPNLEEYFSSNLD